MQCKDLTILFLNRAWHLPFLAGLRKERFLPHFPPLLEHASPSLMWKDRARIPHPWESLISCSMVKNRTDLIITRHLPLGIGNSKLVTLCLTIAGEALAPGTHAPWPGGWCSKWNPGFPGLWFHPALFGKGEHSKMVAAFFFFFCLTVNLIFKNYAI